MPCPMCKRPTETAYRPFCSKRCADLDLGNWLNGSYAIPAEEEDAPDADDYAEDFARESEFRDGPGGAGGKGGRRR